MLAFLLVFIFVFLLWVYKVFNYLIKEMNRDELFKTLTKRNRDVYMSLEKRFKNEETGG